jgi:hypothetical protein
VLRGGSYKEGDMKVSEVFSLGGGGCDCGCGCYNEHAYYHGHFGHYDIGSYGPSNYGAYDNHGFHRFHPYFEGWY